MLQKHRFGSPLRCRFTFAKRELCFGFFSSGAAEIEFYGKLTRPYERRRNEAAALHANGNAFQTHRNFEGGSSPVVFPHEFSGGVGDIRLLVRASESEIFLCSTLAPLCTWVCLKLCNDHVTPNNRTSVKWRRTLLSSFLKSARWRVI